MGGVADESAPEDLWHLTIDDLLSGPAEPKPIGGPGPYVINLSASTAPLGLPPNGLLEFDQLYVYQVQQRENGRQRFRLRLGPIGSELEADAILATVREHYPRALTAAADEDDLRAIAHAAARVEKKTARASAPASSSPSPRVGATPIAPIGAATAAPISRTPVPEARVAPTPAAPPAPTIRVEEPMTARELAAAFLAESDPVETRTPQPGAVTAPPPRPSQAPPPVAALPLAANPTPAPRPTSPAPSPAPLATVASAAPAVPVLGTADVATPRLSAARSPAAAPPSSFSPKPGPAAVHSAPRGTPRSRDPALPAPLLGVRLSAALPPTLVPHVEPISQSAPLRVPATARSTPQNTLPPRQAASLAPPPIVRPPAPPSPALSPTEPKREVPAGRAPGSPAKSSSELVPRRSSPELTVPATTTSLAAVLALAFPPPPGETRMMDAPARPALEPAPRAAPVAPPSLAPGPVPAPVPAAARQLAPALDATLGTRREARSSQETPASTPVVVAPRPAASSVRASDLAGPRLTISESNAAMTVRAATQDAGNGATSMTRPAPTGPPPVLRGAARVPFSLAPARLEATSRVKSAPSSAPAAPAPPSVLPAATAAAPASVGDHPARAAAESHVPAPTASPSPVPVERKEIPARAVGDAAKPPPPTAPVKVPEPTSNLGAPKPASPLDRSQTVRALAQLELADGDSSRLFAIQLAVSDSEFRPENIPNLGIFEEYRLYSTMGLDGERVLHALRLGFFIDERAAEAVAGYLRGHFESAALKRISTAERDRFAEQRVKARKDAGATGIHAAIELRSPETKPTTSLADLIQRAGRRRTDEPRR